MFGNPEDRFSRDATQAIIARPPKFRDVRPIPVHICDSKTKTLFIIIALDWSVEGHEVAHTENSKEAVQYHHCQMKHCRFVHLRDL